MIRLMTVSDIDEVVEIAAVMFRESRNYRAMIFSPERAREMAGITLKRGFAVVAVEDGKIVGVMGGTLVQPAFSTDLMACDFLLYVLPQYRKGTIAVRLARAYKDWAVRAGATVITVGVTAGINNKLAIAFYKAMGFRVSGVQLMMDCSVAEQSEKPVTPSTGLALQSPNA